MLTLESRRLHQPARVRAAQAALLDEDAAALLEEVRGVLCEPTRTQIVRALSRGPLSVGDLAQVIGRSKWATSQHLRVLRSHGLVEPARRGRLVHYRLSSHPALRPALAALELVAAVSAA